MTTPTTPKTWFITGASSGFGTAFAEHALERGDNVVATARSIARLEALVARAPDRVLAVKLDVTKAAEIQPAVDAAVRRFGAIHGAVCAAGIGTAERVLGKEGVQPLEHFARVVDINLVGTFNVIRLAAAAMATNEPAANGERGVIVSTASVAAFDGQIGQAAYAASKGGIVALTLPLAREFARVGIRVMTIAPGTFDTPLLAGLPQAARESLAQQVPFPPRLGRPAEFAALVRHIFENEMLNGEVIRLDGAIRMAPK
jgi:NAD(P)-dependent dehydrogenase (short-subunit alcohol dehydrogenase family)